MLFDFSPSLQNARKQIDITLPWTQSKTLLLAKIITTWPSPIFPQGNVYYKCLTDFSVKCFTVMAANLTASQNQVEDLQTRLRGSEDQVQNLKTRLTASETRLSASELTVQTLKTDGAGNQSSY